MDTKALLKKVRKIEIKTRRLSDHVFGGEYHSTFKGRGMTFSEVRQYQFGDDVRAIDWNVTARYNEPFVKIFEEERELTLMLVVDVSGSEVFGTRSQFKRETLTEIAERVEIRVKNLWASETGPEAEEGQPPKIRNYFFVAGAGGRTLFGASAIQDTRVRELIPVLTRSLFGEPGTFGFFTQPSLFQRGFGG